MSFYDKSIPSSQIKLSISHLLVLAISIVSFPLVIGAFFFVPGIFPQELVEAGIEPTQTNLVIALAVALLISISSALYLKSLFKKGIKRKLILKMYGTLVDLEVTSFKERSLGLKGVKQFTTKGDDGLERVFEIVEGKETLSKGCIDFFRSGGKKSWLKDSLVGKTFSAKVNPEDPNDLAFEDPMVD